ncbi:MAG: HTH domain-containing protein [Dysgonamonadaceae bacterium]|jgi:ATP-dependent DNA helicase RecG|nr:HTH domain-containing protein [Dysgonamonadaceae bacterium]
MGHFQDEITIKDDVTLSSDIISQVEDVMAFIRKHINKEIIITNTQVENIQRWQYPLDAIREIVLNMIVHRDYRDSGHSIIKIFKDHISFYNPGTLMFPLTIEDLLSNQYVSKPRNRQIASLIKDIGWIEKYGTGIRRIRKMFRDYGSKEPDFEIVSGCFAVTAYAVDYGNVRGNDTETAIENLTTNLKSGVKDGVKDGVKNLLLLIENNPAITTRELSEQLNIPFRTIQRYIEKLKKANTLERIDGKKGGYWQITR